MYCLNSQILPTLCCLPNASIGLLCPPSKLVIGVAHVNAESEDEGMLMEEESDDSHFAVGPTIFESPRADDVDYYEKVIHPRQRMLVFLLVVSCLLVMSDFFDKLMRDLIESSSLFVFLTTVFFITPLGITFGFFKPHFLRCFTFFIALQGSVFFLHSTSLTSWSAVWLLPLHITILLLSFNIRMSFKHHWFFAGRDSSHLLDTF